MSLDGACYDCGVRCLWCVFSGFCDLAAISFVLQLPIKRLMTACGVYRFVWHRALFDLAIYAILLAVVTAAAATILPLA